MYGSKNLFHLIIKIPILITLITFFFLMQPRYVIYAEVGELICGIEQDQQSPMVAYVDEDCYLIVWQDYRSGISFDIYGAGIHEGEKFGPIAICTATRDQENPVVAWNGMHYVVVWKDNRNGSFYDIYGARVTKSGILMDGPASSGGKEISKAPKNQVDPDLVWNGKDCFLVVWEDNRNNDADIYGMRVSSDLALYDGPAEEGGIELCLRTGEQKSPSVAWNGSYFLVVWEDYVSAERTDIRGIRVSPAGNIMDDVWDGGIAISVDDNIQCNPDVASNGEGFFIVWDTHTTEQGYPDIYGILVDKTGNTITDESIAINTSMHNQVNPAVLWTGNNYICLWKDDRDNSVDVYWTRVDNMGKLLNSEINGGGISLNLTHASCIYTPPAASFYQGKGIIIWEENYAAQLDIYGMDLIPPIPPVIEWAKGIGYESDGVEPDKGFGGTIFTFRVLYKDTEAMPPQIAQVWIDLDGDGIFNIPDDIKLDMSLAPEEISPDYLSGVIYQAEAVLEYQTDEKITYRFYFKDDIDDAVGQPNNISTVVVENNPPILSWCDLEGYYSDGVDPNQAEGSFTFKFMVNYRDIESDLPEVAEVWVDLDDSGTYEQRERFIMQEADQGTISSGRNYKKTAKVLYAGDGRLNYRFLFTDGYHLALGDPNQADPTKNHTFIVQPHLRAPILSWPSDEGFIYGARLGTGNDKNLITFKVGYCDPDNDPPLTMQVWVDLNGDESFREDERFKMSPEISQGNDFTKINYYIKQMSISYSGDGEMLYKFVFDDGWNIATGEPFLEGAAILVQSPIYLEWPAKAGFETDGVDPDAGQKGSSFEFRIIYINQNGYPPYTKQVWLDEDLDGQFTDNEKYVMEDANLTDFNYTDGKEYFKIIEYRGDKTGLIPYKFIFNDIYMDATGSPTEEYLTIQILNNNGVQGSIDPLMEEDNLSLRMLDMVSKGCFITNLAQALTTPKKTGYGDNNIGFNPGKNSYNEWIRVLKFGLIALFVMGVLIVFLLYSFCTIRGS